MVLSIANESMSKLWAYIPKTGTSLIIAGETGANPVRAEVLTACQIYNFNFLLAILWFSSNIVYYTVKFHLKIAYGTEEAENQRRSKCML